MFVILTSRAGRHAEQRLLPAGTFASCLKPRELPSSKQPNTPYTCVMPDVSYSYPWRRLILDYLHGTSSSSKQPHDGIPLEPPCGASASLRNRVVPSWWFRIHIHPGRRWPLDVWNINDRRKWSDEKTPLPFHTWASTAHQTDTTYSGVLT